MCHEHLNDICKLEVDKKKKLQQKHAQTYVARSKLPKTNMNGKKSMTTSKKNSGQTNIQLSTRLLIEHVLINASKLTKN